MGMANSGCCCENPTGGVPDDPCEACLPETEVDCLTIQKSTWDKPRKLVPWAEYLTKTPTELCGGMAAGGTNSAFIEGSPDYCRYFGTYILTWQVNGRVTGPEDDNCDKINIHFRFYPDRWDTLKHGILHKGSIRTFIVQADRDWITTGITFDEPGYAEGHAARPEQYPLPIPTYTVSSGCPEDFPKIDEAPVILRGEAAQDPPRGDDLCDNTGDIDAYHAGTLYVGDCIYPCPFVTQHSFAPTWAYDTETDEIVLYSGGDNGSGNGWADLWREHRCVPSQDWFSTEYPGAVWPWDRPILGVEPIRIAFDDGGWKDTGPWVFTTPYDSVVVDVALAMETYTVTLVDDCPIGPEPWEPPGPVPNCYRKSLCLQVRMNKDETDPDAPTFEAFTQCTLPWVKGVNHYFYEYCDGPEGRPFKVRVTVWEDPASAFTGYPTYYRAWRILIEIVDSTTEAVIDDHEEVVMLNCFKDWSYTHTFTIDDESVEVYIGTKCPTLTIVPPEECDPGCWPECVMCPERKTLYAVVSDAPDCCLSGAYALTWVGTGGGGAPTVGYYELPATVGGPIDTCGQITFLRVSCVDSTHITVQLVYLRAEGTEISNLSSPATLSVICDESGNLESDAINVPGRSGGRESLCGFGSGVGGDIRIVST